MRRLGKRFPSFYVCLLCKVLLHTLTDHIDRMIFAVAELGGDDIGVITPEVMKEDMESSVSCDVTSCRRSESHRGRIQSDEHDPGPCLCILVLLISRPDSIRMGHDRIDTSLSAGIGSRRLRP